MKLKWRWGFELLFVLAAITVLLTIMIPRFLRSQESRKLVMLFQDMDRLICAVAQYQIDYGYLTNDFSPALQTSITNNSISTNRLDCITERHPEFFLSDFDFFLRNDYLDIDPKDMTINLPDAINNNQIQYNGIIESRNSDTYKVHLFEIHVFWQDGSEENKEAYFQKKYRLIKDPYTINNHEPLMESNRWYAPSNGIGSAGYVYLDIHGNHSPFGREDPGLRILNLQDKLWEKTRNP